MLVGGIIGSVISAASSAITQKALTGSVDGASVAISAVTGAYSELDWLPNFLSYKPW